MLEAAVGTKEAPALTLLAENARYTRAVSVFPSLTPVCVSSIVTGAYPDRIGSRTWSGTTVGRDASSSTDRRSARSAGRACASRSSTRS